MRLFAFPAALFLAFILYCAAPKLAEWLPRAFQKLYALFRRLDERAPRELAFPAFLLTLMLAPFLLALIHPAVEAVLMAFPLFGLSRIPISANSIPARMQGISPLTKPSSAKRAPRWLPPSSRMSVRRSC